MTPQNLILIMAMILVLMAWWANSSKRNKIYCSFIRENKTSLHKFVRMTSRYIFFDGKRYNIIPKCIVFDWWDKGLVHMLFPQWVATLGFTYASDMPNDPETNQPVLLSPEVRKLMNKEEMFREYNKTLSSPNPKKQTFIQQYLPWAAVIMVLLVAVYFYTNMQAVNHAIIDMTNRINAIAK